MARNGEDVTLVEQADDHLEATLDLVIVAVKTQHTASALELIEPHLAPDSVVMPLQNGISALWIADRIGQQRTVPSSITTNNFYTSPGHLRYNRKGVVHVGETDGRITPRIEQMVQLLGH